MLDARISQQTTHHVSWIFYSIESDLKSQSQQKIFYPLVNQHRYGISQCVIGKSAICAAFFDELLVITRVRAYVLSTAIINHYSLSSHVFSFRLVKEFPCSSCSSDIQCLSGFNELFFPFLIVLGMMIKIACVIVFLMASKILRSATSLGLFLVEIFGTAKKKEIFRIQWN